MRRALVCLFLAAISGYGAAPAISPGGIVNGASFAPQPDPLAPGSIVSIFGIGLAPSVMLAPGLPLPATLNGTTVNFGDKQAPLIFVSPNQINAQIPFEVSAGMVSVNVKTAEGTSASVSVEIAPVAPALFTASSTGYGPVAAQHADGSPVDAARPPRAGETVVLYGTGFGAVRDPISSGAAATGANPTKATVRVNVGGKAARVEYAGLAPGFVGLYQVNIVLPNGVLPGDPIAVNQDILNSSGQPAGQRSGNPALLGEVPAGGLAKFLPFPEGTQALGAPEFLLTLDAFLAYEGRDDCVKTVAVFQFHDRTAGVARGLPEGVSCIARQIRLQTAPAPAPGQPPVTRLVAPTFAADASPALANGFVAVDLGSQNSTVIPLPGTLGADRFDANFLNTVGANTLAPARMADGAPGAGMLVIDARNNMRIIPSPPGQLTQFYGGQMLFDLQNNIVYSTAGRAANGPFTEIVAVNLRGNTAELVLPPPGLNNGNTGRIQLDARNRLLVSLTSDGSATSPAFNFRLYDLQAGSASAIALPAGVLPSMTGLNNNVPQFFYVSGESAAFVPVVSSANRELVTGLVLLDLNRGTATNKALPSGVKDLSFVQPVGGEIYGFANVDGGGGATGFLIFNPLEGRSTLFRLPAGVAAIGRGQAGKPPAQGPTAAAAGRGYTLVLERNLVVAPGSKSDPNITDAGLVVFDIANGASRVIPLPSGVFRLHNRGSVFIKDATNKAYSLGESGAPGVADVLVWFDLGAGTSGKLAAPDPITQLRAVFYHAFTGMAVGTAEPTRGYAVWQLP